LTPAKTSQMRDALRMLDLNRFNVSNHEGDSLLPTHTKQSDDEEVNQSEWPSHLNS
jgi:hypothetical protein